MYAIRSYYGGQLDNHHHFVYTQAAVLGNFQRGGLSAEFFHQFVENLEKMTLHLNEMHRQSNSSSLIVDSYNFV